MKKFTCLISEKICEEQELKNMNMDNKTSNRIFYFLYYTIVCNLIALSLPIIFYSYKIPYSINVSIYIYNFICIMITIFLIIMLKLKGKNILREEHKISHLKFFLIKFFFISKIFLDSMIIFISIPLIFQNSLNPINIDNENFIKLEDLRNNLNFNRVLSEATILFIFFNLALLKFCSIGNDKYLSDINELLSLFILSVISFLITYFILIGTIFKINELMYFEAVKFLYYIFIFIDKKITDFSNNNKRDLLKLIDSYKEFLDFFQTNMESKITGFYLYKEKFIIDENKIPKEQNNAKLERKFSYRKTNSVIQLMQNANGKNIYNENNNIFKNLNSFKNSEHEKLNYDNIYETNSFSTKLKENIFTMNHNLLNFNQIVMAQNQNPNEHQINLNNLNNNILNSFQNNGINSSYHIPTDKKFFNSENSNFRTSRISRFQKKGRQSLTTNFNNELNSNFNLISTKAYKDEKLLQQNNSNENRRSSKITTIYYNLNNSSNFNHSGNFNSIKAKFLNNSNEIFNFENNYTQRERKANLISTKKLSENLSELNLGNNTNIFDSGNLKPPKRVNSNPMLKAYLQLNNLYAIKELSEVDSSPFPYMILGMMKSNLNSQKKNTGGNKKFKSRKNFYLNPLENSENLKLEKIGLNKKSHSNTKSNILFNNMSNNNSNTVEKSKFLHQSTSKNLSSDEIIINTNTNNIKNNDKNNNTINIKESDKLKKTHIIRELSEEESLNNTLKTKSKNGIIISGIDINLKIEREREKDSSFSSSYIQDKNENSKSLKYYISNNNKSYASKNFSYVYDIDENVVDIKKNMIRTINTINLTELKSQEKLRRASRIKIEENKKDGIRFIERYYNHGLNKKAKSSHIVNSILRKNNSLLKNNDIYSIEITKILADNQKKRDQNPLEGSPFIIASKHYRRFSRSLKDVAFTNINKNIGIKKNYKKQYKMSLLSPSNLLIKENSKHFYNSMSPKFENMSNNSNSSSNFNSNSNSRLSNSIIHKSTIRKIIGVDNSKAKSKNLYSNDLKIINQNYKKNKISRNNSQDTDNLFEEKETIKFKSKIKNFKKLTKFSNKRLVNDRNIVFTISPEKCNINLRDKDSFYSKYPKSVSEYINFEENKLTTKSLCSLNNSSNNKGEINNRFNREINLKLIDSEEFSKIAPSENNISKKTLNDIRISNKKINQKEKIRKKDFIDYLNQVNNNSKIIYQNDNNQNSNDSKNISGVINFKSLKYDNKLASGSLNTWNNSDNIKLLSQEKPSEMSSIIANSNFNKNNNNLFTNKDQYFYSSLQNTGINNTNQFYKYVNISENISDYELKISLKIQSKEENKNKKLIEDEKLNFEIRKLFNNKNLENQNEESSKLVEYNQFIDEIVKIFDRTEAFNFYNDVGPFCLILEKKHITDNLVGNNNNNILPLTLDIMISIKSFFSEEDILIQSKNNNDFFNKLKSKIKFQDLFVKTSNLMNETIMNHSSRFNLNFNSEFDSFQYRRENNNENKIESNQENKIEIFIEKNNNKKNDENENNKFISKNQDNNNNLIIDQPNNDYIIKEKKENFIIKDSIITNKNANFQEVLVENDLILNNLEPLNKMETINKQVNLLKSKENDVSKKHNNKQKCFLILVNEIYDIKTNYKNLMMNIFESKSNENLNHFLQNQIVNNNLAPNSNQNNLKNTISLYKEYFGSNPYNQKDFYSSEIKSFLPNTNSRNLSTINFTINNNISMNNYLKNSNKDEINNNLLNNKISITHDNYRNKRKSSIKLRGQSRSLRNRDRKRESYYSNKNSDNDIDIKLNLDKIKKKTSTFTKNNLLSSSSSKINTLQNTIITSTPPKISNLNINMKKFSSVNNIPFTPLNSMNNNYEKAPNSVKAPSSLITNKNNLNNSNFNLKQNYKNQVNQINNSNSNQTLSNPLLFEKLSALLHDFKHIVYDNLIYFDHLVSKYIFPLIANQNPNSFNNNFRSSSDFFTNSNAVFNSNFNLDHNTLIRSSISNANILNKNNISGGTIIHSKPTNNFDINKLKEELIYLNVIKDYTISLILNITNFMSDNEFLAGNLDEPIDLKKIVNLMVLIFKRRIEYENTLLETLENNNINLESNYYNVSNNTIKKPLKKDVIIKPKFIDAENIVYTRLKSNKNLIISLLYNLISNAYKYTEKGEIIIETSIETFKLNNSLIIVKVYDTGAGIPKEILKNWGKPFNLKDKSKGTGLGQFLINSISQKLGFKIFKPEKNPFSSTGTLIKIEIPIEDIIAKDLNSNFAMTIVNNSGFLFNNQNNLSNINQINENYLFNNIYNNSSNHSSGNLKSTIINNNPFIIDDTLFRLSPFSNIISNNSSSIISNNVNFVGNNLKNNILISNNGNQIEEIFVLNRSKTSNFSPQKIIYILCLDDDQIFLSMLASNLKILAKEFPFIKFEFILTSCFQDFFAEFMGLTMKNIAIDFFIMDQNISHSLKGVDCCRLVNKFYKTYFKEKYNSLKFHFFFVTEETNLHKFKILKNKANLIKKDQIFSKMQFKNLYTKLIEIIAIKE